MSHPADLDKARAAVRSKSPRHQLLVEIRALFAALLSVGRARFWGALVLLVLGGFTEGLSILLLLPLLKLISGGGAADHALDLGQYQILGVALPAVTIGLAPLLALFVGLVVVIVVFNRVKSAYLSDMLFDFTNGVRLSLFRALSRARWDRIIRTPTSVYEHALTGEVERISTSGFYLLSIAQSSVMLLLYIAMSAVISPAMTLVMLLFGAITLVLMRPYRRRAAQFGELLQSTRKQQYSIVADFLNGLKIARATNSEPVFYHEFGALLEANKRDARDYVRHSATGAGLFQIAITLGAAIFIYLAVAVFAIEFARLVVMLLVAMRIAPRFMGLQMQLQQLLPDMAAWRHVCGLEAELRLAEDDSARGAIAVPPLREAISFEAVSYRHEGSARAAVEGLTLRIEAGKVTALIGASGSGKSTVADLVTGLVRPQTGVIRFDGRVLTPPELRGWRDQIAYVAQENFLLDLSVRENLSLIQSRAVEDEALWQALETAGAAEFVRQLPAGLDAVIGSRGVQISGGQRQRLALAQAFLRQPRCLVLDEATSALDWKAQERISLAVREMARQGTTVLTIAHRPSMVVFADRIYALAEGRVIEAGSAEALRARADSQFSQMLRKETQGLD